MDSNDDFMEIETALNDALARGEIDPNDYHASAERAMSSRGFIYAPGSGCTCPLGHDAEYGHHFSCGWVEP